MSGSLIQGTPGRRRPCIYAKSPATAHRKISVDKKSANDS